MSKSILTPIKLARIASDPVGSTASLYYNSTTNTVKFYNGSTWITLLSGANASLFWRYTAVGAETTLSGLDSGSQILLYTAGYEQVFLNGVMLIRGTDYTATDGSTISLASALVSGDYIVVLAVVSTALAAGGYAPTASPTFTGTVTFPLTTAGYVKTTSAGVISSAGTVPWTDVSSTPTTLSGYGITDGLTSSTAASTYLTQSNASSTYLTQSNASSTYLPITTASSTYLTITNAGTTYLTQTNAVSTYVSLSGSYSNPTWITGLAWSKISSTPTTLSGYGITDALSSTTAASTYLTISNAGTTYSPIAGSSSITTLGTVTSGSFPVANLSGTTLPSAVVNSSLTKIGSLSAGTAGFVKIDASGNLTSDSSTYLTISSASSTYLTITNASTTYATLGANSNITSLTGLTTPLSTSQGGTGTSTSLIPGGVVFGDASGKHVTSANAVGTAGQFLMSYGDIANGGPEFISLPIVEEVMAATATALAGSGTWIYVNNTPGTTPSTLTNTSLSTYTIDTTYTFVAGDRVLIKNQATAYQNGVYVITQISPYIILTRDNDSDTIGKLGGAIVSVNSGSTNGGKLFVCSNRSNDIMGSTAINFNSIIDSSYTSLPTVTNVNGTTIPGSAANIVTSVDASLSIPTQSANNGKYLTTNGTTLSWATVTGGGSGTVTSIVAGTGLTGGTITTSGTIAIDTSVVPQLGTANTFTGNQTMPVTVLTGGTSDPTAPSGTALSVYSKTLGGKPFLFTEASGARIALIQNSLFQKNIGLFTPGAGSTTLPPLIGSGTYTQPTTAATLTARTLATTNNFTRTKRIGFVTNTTAGRFAGVYLTGANWAIGDGSTYGGFYFAFRFGISDATLVSAPRMFLGLSSSVATPTNVEPSTLTNIIGVGMGAADTNLKIFYGGSAAQTPIDLGTNFPVTTSTNQGYEVIFSNAYTSNNSVSYQITNLNTGTVATGTLTAATPGTQLPASTTFLGHQLWRTNNATAAAAGLDLGYVYCEGDAS